MLVVFVLAVLLPFPHGRPVTGPPASHAKTRTVDESPEGSTEP
jgi:hypothetical protein